MVEPGTGSFTRAGVVGPGPRSPLAGLLVDGVAWDFLGLEHFVFVWLVGFGHLDGVPQPRDKPIKVPAAQHGGIEDEQFHGVEAGPQMTQVDKRSPGCLAAPWQCRRVVRQQQGHRLGELHGLLYQLAHYRRLFRASEQFGDVEADGFEQVALIMFLTLLRLHGILPPVVGFGPGRRCDVGRGFLFTSLVCVTGHGLSSIILGMPM